MVTVQRTRQTLKLAFCKFCRFALPSVTQGTSNTGVHVLRKMAQDVTRLVSPTPLHLGELTVDLGDRATQCLGAIDHKQHRALGGQASLDQLAEKSPGYSDVLRGAFTQSQHVLSTLRIQP